MDNQSDVLAIRSLHIAIAKKYLEDGRYTIKDFYLCNTTDTGMAGLHIEKDEELMVAIKKIKADVLWTEDTKYIIISKRVLEEGQYPIIISKEIAEAYLISKKDKNGKPVKLTDETQIKELQNTLATIFGIY